MDYVITALGLGLLAATAYWLGLRAQRREAVQRPPHRTLVVGVEGFCRLIRGWEWVAPTEGGGTVGITLRGVGGTIGMQLALVQVEREIAAGNVLPIRLDRVSGLVAGRSSWAAAAIHAAGDPIPGYTAAEANRASGWNIEDSDPIGGWRLSDPAEFNLPARILDDPDGAAREGIVLGDQAEP